MTGLTIISSGESIEIIGTDRRLGFVGEPPASWFLVLPDRISQSGEMKDLTIDKMIELLRQLVGDARQDNKRTGESNGISN